MSIIKERIKFNNKDINLKISLGGNNRFSGHQQEIDGLTEETKLDLINPIIDHEVRRFSYVPNSINILNFFFDSVTPTSFENAGFTTTEIENRDNVLLNSFFIMEYYDNFDPYTQTKIFSLYNTQVLNGSSSGEIPIPSYVVNSSNLNQFYHWFVPKSYLDTQTGSTINGYIKFSFYNAKTGQVFLFYNKQNESLSTPEKMYLKTILNLNDMTWDLDVETTFLGNISLYEIPRTNSYVNKVNETFENFQNLQQEYPIGAFDPEDGKYGG